ncbi:hypothetical protein KOM00_17510 [Geomonas sp. Red69]|uniref:Uncharacterized protein n=1 Tax=Geomonas diazotrophica TaxID=2843197 RepID=A0ABX8JHG9_9BACT|nr:MULTISPECIES: hypothetical protein [Geomonas]MBU5638528.1 hypothetical protein [Geomonas diazotrophica]QWV97198.1 hypothetical protein KP005_17930 [Geomonas nitrogeniifigens]
MENGAFEITKLWESVALNLLQLCMRDFGDKDFGVLCLGDDVHLKVTGLSTDTEINVVGGGEYNDLGKQLVLACLQKLSAGDLVELHLKELNNEADVLKQA